MRIIQSIAKTLLPALCLLCLLAVPALAATKMPHFVLPSAEDGANLDSNSYHGQALLVNFFATWCPPCRQEIPSLISIQKEYGSKGLAVIGISTDQGGSSLVAKFAKKMEVNYPVLMSDSATPTAFGGILGIPTSFLINKEGNVVKRYDGYVDHQTLVNDLNTILR